MDKLSQLLRDWDYHIHERDEEREYYFNRLLQQSYRDEHEHRNYKSKKK